MATKNELIARLVQLSAEIGRELDTSGSTADLELRIREAEEELAALTEVEPMPAGGAGIGPEAGSGSSPESDKPDESLALSDEVSVRVLRTITLTTKGKNGAWRASVVKKGSDVTLQQRNYASLPAGLVSKIP